MPFIWKITSPRGEWEFGEWRKYRGKEVKESRIPPPTPATYYHTQTQSTNLTQTAGSWEEKNEVGSGLLLSMLLPALFETLETFCSKRHRNLMNPNEQEDKQKSRVPTLTFLPLCSICSPSPNSPHNPVFQKKTLNSPNTLTQQKPFSYNYGMFPHFSLIFLSFCGVIWNSSLDFVMSAEK